MTIWKLIFKLSSVSRRGFSLHGSLLCLLLHSSLSLSPLFLIHFSAIYALYLFSNLYLSLFRISLSLNFSLCCIFFSVRSQAQKGFVHCSWSTVFSSALPSVWNFCKSNHRASLFSYSTTHERSKYRPSTYSQNHLIENKLRVANNILTCQQPLPPLQQP